MRLWFHFLVCSFLLSMQLTLAGENSPDLAEAIQHKNRSTITRLLADGADVNTAQADGTTPLHWAAYHDDFDLAKVLIKADAKVDAANRYGMTALSIACQNGSQRMVDLLLESGADCDLALPGGETPLMTAARTGRSGPVKSLLKHNANVNATEQRGQTALMWAAAEGHTEVVDLLLEAGADFRTPLKSGFTPFFFAVREGKIGVCKRLLAAGIDVNAAMQVKNSGNKGPNSGTSALLLAVENGHFELASTLLEAGADPNDNRRGYTALHAITWIRKPVRGDGDPAPEGSGRTSSLEFVEKLIEQGANVNARHGKQGAGRGALNRTEATAFLLAAETGDLELMKLLLKLGADPTLTNIDECTPLLAAAGVGAYGSGDLPPGTEEEAIEVVKFLLELGADINAIDQRKNTAMHGAAFKNAPRLVKFLAEQGADQKLWNNKNKFGWTPMKIAEGYRFGNFRPSPETIAALRDVMSVEAE